MICCFIIKLKLQKAKYKGFRFLGASPTRFTYLSIFKYGKPFFDAIYDAPTELTVF